MLLVLTRVQIFIAHRRIKVEIESSYYLDFHQKASLHGTRLTDRDSHMVIKLGPSIAGLHKVAYVENLYSCIVKCQNIAVYC